MLLQVAVTVILSGNLQLPQKAFNSSNFVGGMWDIDFTTLIIYDHKRHLKLWLAIILRSAVNAFYRLISLMASGEEDDAITTLRIRWA